MIRAKYACLVVAGLVAACDKVPHGGTPDAQVDAPVPDAPPEVCSVPPPPPFCAATDLVGKLRCFPGMQVTQATNAPPGYQRFNLVLTQPVDHDDPGGPSFTQRAVLFHISDTAPVVVSTSGYSLSAGPTEITQAFGANQLSYEHRHFAESRPDPLDWSKLDIWQAANDVHRLVSAVRWLYPGRWVNTGASKGGMTSVYHRRFFPCDVDATVAYVAPTSLGAADPAYVTFLDNVGGDDQAACRADLVAFQRRLLEQRAQILPLVEGAFTQLDVDKVYEMAVIELNFALWQYTSPDDPVEGCSAIPGPTATPAEMLRFLNRHVSPDELGGDDSLDFFHAYYHQAAHQLGAPAPYETPYADLLQYPGLDVAATFIPAGEVTAFDAQAMPDVNSWVATESTQMMFIYGELDPWSSRPFVPSSHDSHRFFVAGGNHGSSISQLSDADRATALSRLASWLEQPVPAAAGFARRAPPATVAPADRTDRAALRELRPPR